MTGLNEKSQSQSQSKVTADIILFCNRCKRVTHDSLQCHAKKDILGNSLPDFNFELLREKQVKVSKKRDVGSDNGNNASGNGSGNASGNGNNASGNGKDNGNNGKATKRNRLSNEKSCKKKGLKSKDCLQWIAGKCVLGDDCFFLHNPEKGYDPRSKQLCQFYRSGSCLKSLLCPFSHDKSKFACVFYHWKGGCKNEPCSFSHAPLTSDQKENYDRDQEKFENQKIEIKANKKKRKREKKDCLQRNDLLAIYNR